MAVQSATLAPSGSAAIQVLAQTNLTSSAEIVLGNDAIFAINSDCDITIKFGNPGMAAATGIEYRIPANQQTTFYTSTSFTSIRIWNTGKVNGVAGTAASNTYIQKLSRF